VPLSRRKLRLEWTARVAACAASAVFCACKPDIKDTNIEAVNSRHEAAQSSSRSHLSPKEVESILGQPTRIERTELELETQKKQIPVTRYYYEQDGKSLEVHFIDNKLVSKIPKLSDQEPANRP
jgi:hypothetical protein